ncbi:MAG TPA: hypothetical protein VI159_00505 [Gemmatimonadales bacterium]
MIQWGEVAIKARVKVLLEKTIADVFADALATRPGHPVFPWVISGGWGFREAFAVAGAPRFVRGSEYPIRIPLQAAGARYANALSEREAVDLWHRRLLWNAIGKKSLGRGKGLSHQTPEEDKQLQNLLQRKNPEPPVPLVVGTPGPRGVPLDVDLRPDGWERGAREAMLTALRTTGLGGIDPGTIAWRRGNQFIAEKGLEAWLMRHLDDAVGAQFRAACLVPGAPVTWFANYLPFGVAGANLDVLAFQEQDGRRIATVVELKKDRIGATGYRAAARQATEYRLFLQRAFAAYGGEHASRAVVVSLAERRVPRPAAEEGVLWVTYSISPEGDVHFARLV